ncbi:MAG TPA: LD-carboxypeptidase [Polyangiaceae bacterium]|nr:LD-carboxypeptidase [Polyangiaceae bacterium]
MIFPPALRPGDPIAVIAPSGAVGRAPAQAGIDWLETRYRVRHGPSIFARDGYLAGSDRRRIQELQGALDSDVCAVVAARGGYGLSRIAHLVDWSRAKRAPRWIVGFSDITALHVESWRRGLATVHGSMACSLSRANQAERAAWLATLEDPRRARRWTGLAPWRKGKASGTLVGGNLAMLHACAAAGRLRIPRGAIVLIEDIGEYPYRVDRMLTNLIIAGHFAKAAGVLVGDFTDCATGPDGRTVEEVLRERLRSLSVPVAAGMPVGHGHRNDAVVFGAPAVLDASRGVVSVF